MEPIYSLNLGKMYLQSCVLFKERESIYKSFAITGIHMHLLCSVIFCAELMILPELSRLSCGSAGDSAVLVSVFTFSSATCCSKDEFIPHGAHWRLWNTERKRDRAQVKSLYSLKGMITTPHWTCTQEPRFLFRGPLFCCIPFSALYFNTSTPYTQCLSTI